MILFTPQKEELINNALVTFRYSSRRLNKINSFKEVPDMFKGSGIFGPIVYNYYTKKGGQFFYISTGFGKYMVLLLKGKIAAINGEGENVSPSDIETEMKINQKYGVTLKEVLEYLSQNKITESDIRRIIQKVLS